MKRQKLVCTFPHSDTGVLETSASNQVGRWERMAVQGRRVLEAELAHRSRWQMLQLVPDQRLGLRPTAVLMRVVTLQHHVVLADQI